MDVLFHPLGKLAILWNKELIPNLAGILDHWVIV